MITTDNAPKCTTTSKLIRSDYLSKQNTDCLKGIFAVCILLHHLYQHSGLLRGNPIGVIFQILGYLSVGIFFFLSGYGLMFSYNTKGRAYVKNLPYKRILPFYLCYLLFVLLYIIEKLIFGEEILTSQIIKSLLFGGAIVMNGWYLQVSILIYFLFFFVFLFSSKRSVQFISTGVALLIFSVVCAALSMPSTWYESIFALLLGMVFASNKDRFDAFTDKLRNLLFLIAVSFVLFCITVVLQMILGSGAIAIIIKAISALMFVVFVISALRLIRINFMLTRLLGKISFEIYASQGLCLALYHSNIIDIGNPYLYVLLVTVTTIIESVIIHPVIKLIYKLFRKSTKAVAVK